MTLLERDRLKYEEGMEQGIEKGIEKGIEQGIEQGIELERTLLVLNMLAANVSVEDIARLTKLSIEEITRIKEAKK